MYESRFGITGPPFQLSPDPGFYFGSGGHERALTELRNALSEESGFSVVSGEIGAGKTTLVRTLLAELDPASFAIAHVVSTQLNAVDLLGAVSISFGIQAVAAQHQVLASRLFRFLAKLDGGARRALLIVDEAQNLPRDAFDELVEIARAPRHLPLHICLIGQPELRSIVEAADMGGLRDLIGASCYLGPIAREETGAYIEHRLRKVGWSGSPCFEPGAFDEIFRWTDGIPRRINLLCNRLLLSRFLANDNNVEVGTVERTARDLRAEMSEPGEEPAVLSPTAARRQLPPQQAATPVRRARVPVMGPLEPGPLLCVAADDGDHVKAGALMRALSGHVGLPTAKLVRIHDNDALARSGVLFAGLDMTTSVINLGITEGLGAAQTTALTQTFQFVVDHLLPRAVIVFGGCGAALTCCLVAHAKGIPIVHVGTGLQRSDGALENVSAKCMPTTDALADLLYTSDSEASQTLADGGTPLERIHCVGTLLADAVQIALRSLSTPALVRVDASPGAGATQALLDSTDGYALVMLKEQVNISDRPLLKDLLGILEDASREIRLVWPMNERLERQVKKFRLDGFIRSERITRLAALPYDAYVALLERATCVITDAWDVQEEATILGVPCLTIGVLPQRHVTVSTGSNVAVGCDRSLATRTLWRCIFDGGRRGRVPELWDGKAGARIAGFLSAWLPEI